MTTFRQLAVDLAGAMILTGLLFIAGDSQSRDENPIPGARNSKDAAAEAGGSGTSTADPALLADSDLATGSAWRETAERLEVRHDYRAVLEQLSRVVDREKGTRQAEARLWRAAFLDRHGLHEVADAIFDSLLAESSRYPLRLRLATAGTAFQAAIGAGRAADAEDAMTRWVEFRHVAERQDAAEVFLPPRQPGDEAEYLVPADLLHSAIDSLEARMHAELGMLMVGRGQSAAAAFHLESALSLGLSEAEGLGARLRLALIETWKDSTGQSLANLERVAADPRFSELRPDLAYTASLELADAYYRAGRYSDARTRYRDVLPQAAGADDSAWVVVQLADASAHLGAGAEARQWYGRYLARWPSGVWTAWARYAAAAVDSTEDASVLDTLRAVP